MRNKKKLWIGLGVGVILLIIVGVAASGGTAVDMVTVNKGSITQTVEDTGYVRAVTSQDLFATQSARVAKVLVETGQAVKTGQPLVVMDNPDLAIQIDDTRTQLSQANAAISGAAAARDSIELQLSDARDELARTEELYQQGGVSKSDYNKARLAVDTLQKSLTQQDSQLATSRAQVQGLTGVLQQLQSKQQQLSITSPMNGIVLNLPAKTEQVLSPGQLIVTVGIPETLEVKADILSDDLAQVQIGQKVRISAPVLGDKVLDGKVTKIYPLAEEKTSALGVIQRRVPVIISFAQPDILKPGYEVTVAIETASRQDVLIIPRETVRTMDEGTKQVMVVQEGKVKHQKVETGIADRDNIEITNGLSAGTQLVRDGSQDLADGTRVKAQAAK
ncbi:MAG: efflux RND transporter periplasmic adaptor subunit [Candidatus Saccharibacteria bacterium]